VIDRVAALEATVARFPISVPFDLAGTWITSREYLFMRLRTTSGREGVAYALSRDLDYSEPFSLLIDVLAGMDTARATSALLPADEIGNARLRSLADICLWDIQAQVAGRPVHELLGTSGANPPIQWVEGYPIEGESAGTFADRIARVEAGGAASIKLRFAGSIEETTARLSATRGAGVRAMLTVDVGWAWSSLADAFSALEAWRPYAPLTIEDAFGADQLDELSRLSAVSADVLISAGDEFTAREIRELAESGAVDILRMDATTVGGISGFVELSLEIGDRFPISPHVNPEVHQHLVVALPGVGPLEMFPPDDRFDATVGFVDPSVVTVASSKLTPPSAPGLGLRIDWEAVAAGTTVHFSTER
jgi:L-alanine-DL-glutamate epimerase-like enolase superfamily enzyme